MQRYNSSMAQIQEQMVFEEYIDSVLQLDDEQFNEYYDSLNQEQQEELNEIIGKIAKGLGKIAVSPITLPYKVGKAAVKGVARAVTSKPAKAVGRAAGKGAVATGKAAVGGIKKLARRLSTTGRADAAAKKADAIAKRTAERERLAREKERLAKERERAKKSGRADQRQAVADRQKELDKEAEKTRDAQKKEIEKEALDDKDVDTIKPIIKQLKKSVKAHDKQAKQLQKDIEDETDLKEQIKDFYTSISRGKKPADGRRFRVKLKVNKMRAGPDELVITGREKDIIKYAIAHLDASPRIKDLGALDLDIGSDEEYVKETDLKEFTDKQIERLRKEYESLRGKETGINPEKFKRLRGMMRRFPKASLLKLAKADIPILTTGAKASLVINHGMKWSQLPEELVPYIDIFADDTLNEQKGKFKEVDPKVYARIAKMMKGRKDEKQSLANMLNYFMPPEVVDMVRDKFGIKTPRGKIKFTDL